MKLDLTTPITSLQGNKLLSPNIDRSKFEGQDEIDVESLPNEDVYTYGDVIEQSLTVFQPKNKNDQLLISALASKVIGEDEIELNDDLQSRLERVLESATQTEGQDQGLAWWITAPVFEELNGGELPERIPEDNDNE